MREELTPLSNSVGEQSSEVNTLGLSFLQPIDVLTTDTVQSTPPPLSGRTRKQKVEMHIALPVMPPSFSSRMFQRSKAHRPQRHSSSSSYPPPPSLTTSSASPSFSPEPSPSQTRPKVRTRSSQNSPLAINSFFYNVPEAAPVPDRLKTSPLITSAQSPFHRRCLSPPLVPALIYGSVGRHRRRLGDDLILPRPCSPSSGCGNSPCSSKSCSPICSPELDSLMYTPLYLSRTRSRSEEPRSFSFPDH